SVLLGEKVRDEIFKEEPLTDQQVAVIAMVYEFCQQLRVNNQMSLAEKIEKLKTFQGMLTPVAGPKPVSQRGRRPQLPTPEDQLSRFSNQLLRFVVYTTGVQLAQSSSWSDIYLNPIPVTITNGNKWFVIVGSAPTSNEGERRIRELEKK